MRLIANKFVLLIAINLAAQSLLAQTWTTTGAPTNLNWSGIASAADGNKLVACVYDDTNFQPGLIYVSSNRGTNWSVTSAPSNFWYGLASSTNGVNLAAIADGGSIYTSSDSGNTWTNTSAPYAAWYSIASSADGTKLVAVAGGSERFIYTSPDGGNTWLSNDVPSSDYWYDVASSANGTKLIAASNSNTNGRPYSGAIYISTNAGGSWTPITVLSNSDWTAVTCSKDGTKVAVAAPEMVFVSLDGGTTWANSNPTLGYFSSMASSADGSKIVLLDNGGRISTSLN